MKDYGRQIGFILRFERERRNITIVEMAEKMHVSKSTISYWEKGDRAITAEKLMIYLSCLDVSADEFFKKVRSIGA